MNSLSRIALATFFLLVWAAVAAQPSFPELTGRVVDNAGLLSPSIVSQIDQQLAEHEASTSNQVVVATIDSLEGYDISDYGYQLGRHWQLGQKEKDNGILLLVAKNDRKVRIDVGYGLEGALTDALSRQIIEQEIIPAFKAGDYEAGIQKGVTSILAAIAGEYTATPSSNTAHEDPIGQLVPLVFGGFVGGQMLLSRLSRKRKRNKKTQDQENDKLMSGIKVGLSACISLIAFFIVGSLIISGVVFLISLFLFFLNGGGRGGSGGFRTGGGGFSGGGSFGGGGFSGGGGSFGGGGASGSW